MSLGLILGMVKGGASYWREILIGLLAVGLLWYRGEYRGCVADQAAAIVEAQRRADELSAKLDAKQRESDAKTEKVKVEYVDRIKLVKADANCPANQYDELGADSVRAILGNPAPKR